jgi:hypothetical protein
MTIPKWVSVNGVVVEGHRVASSPSKDYPYGAIEKQKPIFKRLGLDLSPYYAATMNISIKPNTFELLAPEYIFQAVRWTDLHPPEDFSFSRCKVRYSQQDYEGIVYYPHPETKIRNFQDPSIVEVMAEYIPGISYGSHVELILNTVEVRVIKK